MVIVTPTSKYSEVKEVLDDSQQYFVRQVTNEFITHYHAYPGVIFEVMVESDLLASVTLFKE